jgi:beta-glucosidase
VHPLFPFGYGLSYTTFRFSHLAITPEKANAGSPIQVKFDVSNIGERAGAEVVQLYVGDPSSQIARPPKELKGFLRVLLKPGETRRVTLQLNRRSLAYWDITSRNWKVDPGKFVEYVGDSSENLPLQADFTIK